MMNVHLKTFLHRGLLFGGFGPIVVGVVYWVLSHAVSDFSLSGGAVCLAIVSTYILAFLQAGATVFNQIESWPLPKALLCHFATLYFAYTSCYLLNTWIPFRTDVLLLFTLLFVGIYFVIWITVYFSVKMTSKKLNLQLK